MKIVKQEEIYHKICDCCGQVISNDILGYSEQCIDLYCYIDDTDYYADICFKCIKAHLSKIILFSKTFNDSYINDIEDEKRSKEVDKDNKVNDRKRKIRGIMNDTNFEIIETNEKD